jgi:hypothetical protein
MHWVIQLGQQSRLTHCRDTLLARFSGTTTTIREEKISQIEDMTCNMWPRYNNITRKPVEARGRKPEANHGVAIRNSGGKKPWQDKPKYTIESMLDQP